MIKFSVIIPVYNVEKYLKRCLNSVINQSYQNFETIIVCDKCDDNSEKIVDNYVKKNKKLKKIYAENTGLAKARNIGIEEATGDYLLFLDSDDYLKNNCLDTLRFALEENPDVLRFQVQDYISEKNIVKHDEETFEIMNGMDAFDKLIKYHYVENAWCYCYKTSFWKKYNFKYMDDCIAEDFGLTPLVIAKAKSVKSIAYIGYNYVQRENSLMTNPDYSKKIKKMDDMIKQAEFLKRELKIKEVSNSIITFINNSLIYYSTQLNYKDYKKYNKILKRNNCFDHLVAKKFKHKVRNILIKGNSYLFYKYIVR